ncbi:hypothetical protein AB6F89_02320 [Providencia hangzhouensis]|uniref:hypothetical protein n=1 Tax=Providencia hangzhouensis TaxID=3031799 RepID=UPI0034DCDB04
MKFFIKNKSINSPLILLISLISFFPMKSMIAAQNGGTMTLTLEGIIDLEHPKAATDPYLVEGRLPGRTSTTYNYIYGSKTQAWTSPDFAIFSISPRSTSCVDEPIVEGGPNATAALQKVPGVNKVGIKLTHASGAYAYIVPSLGFSVKLSGNNNIGSSGFVKESYSGVVFEDVPNLVDRSTKGNRQWKLCYTPPDGTRAPGGYNSKRNVSVYIAGPMQMYAPVPIQPGRYSYSGIPLYVGSYGQDNDQDGVSTLQISTSLNVVRVCSISDVSQDNFTIIAGRETEFFRQSSFKYKCTADNKPIYISAIAREGTVDSANQHKLWFDRTGGNITSNTPYLLALPYAAGGSGSLTCKDEGKAGLLNFANQEETLLGLNSVSNVVQDLNIKWAICLNPNTEIGKYRARVEVSIYTKV